MTKETKGNPQGKINRHKAMAMGEKVGLKKGGEPEKKRKKEHKKK